MSGAVDFRSEPKAEADGQPELLPVQRGLGAERDERAGRPERAEEPDLSLAPSSPRPLRPSAILISSAPGSPVSRSDSAEISALGEAAELKVEGAHAITVELSPDSAAGPKRQGQENQRRNESWDVRTIQAAYPVRTSTFREVGNRTLVGRQEWEEIFVRNCVKASGNDLDQTVAQALTKISNAQAWKIFCSRSPFATMITSRWSQVIGMILVALYSYFAVTNWERIMGAGDATYRHFRLNIGVSDGIPTGKAEPTAAQALTHLDSGVRTWGLLRDSCPVPGAVSNRSSSGSQLEFGEGVRVNGLFVETRASFHNIEAQNFTLEASHDGQSWELLVESSACLKLMNTPTLLPIGEAKLVMFDWASIFCLWPDLLAGVISLLVGSAVALVTQMFGFWGLGKMGTLIFSRGSLVLVLTAMAGCCVMSHRGRGEHTEPMWSNAVAFLLWPVSMIWIEEYSIHMSALGGMMQFTYLVYYERRVSGTLTMTNFPWGSFILWIVPIFLLTIRWSIVNKALKAVQPDRKIFDEMWANLTTNSATLAELDVLEDLTETWEQRLRNRHHQVSSPGGMDLSERSSTPMASIPTSSQSTVLAQEPVQILGAQADLENLFYAHGCPHFMTFTGGVQERQKVTSLDQLYTISAIVQPVFRHKVAQLALRSGGWLRVRSVAGEKGLRSSDDDSTLSIERLQSDRPSDKGARSSGAGQSPQPWREQMGNAYERLSSVGSQQTVSEEFREPSAQEFWPYHLIKGDQMKEARIFWTERKSVSRSVDKLASSYCNEVFRLLDLTREVIAFSSVKDIIRCLSAIHADKDCDLLRIKNRMRRSHDSRQSAGWRDVTIVMRIRTQETLRWGVDGHCCELQLALKSMLVLRNPAQHSRYLQFREVNSYRPIGTWFLETARLPTWLRVRSSDRMNGQNMGVPFSVRPASTISSSSLIEEGEPSSIIPAQTPAEGLRPEEEEGLSHFMKYTLLQRCWWPGGVLGSLLYQNHHAFIRAKTGSVLYTASPVTAALSKRITIVFLILSLVILFWRLCIPNIRDWSNGYRFQARHFRLVVEAQRNSSASPHLVNVKDFGVMRGGCHLTGMEGNLSYEGNQVEFSATSTVEVDGWFFQTWNGSIEQDPVLFRFEARQDGGDWMLRALGGCTSYWNNTHFPPAECFGSRRFAFNTPAARMEMQKFDLKLPWHGQFSLLGQQCSLSLGVLLGIGCAIGQQPTLAKHCICMGLLAGGVAIVLGGYAGVIAGNSGGSAMANVVWGLLYMVLGAVASSKEPWLPIYYCVHVLLVTILNWTHNWLVIGGFFGKDLPPLAGLVFGCFIFFLLLLRRAETHRAKIRIARFRKMYDTLWGHVREQEGEKLQQLADAIALIPQNQEAALQRMPHSVNSLSSVFLRHGRGPTKQGSTEFDAGGLSRESGETQLVTSLDQLYAHAAGNYDELKRKAQIWALASQGCFPLLEPSENQSARYIRFSEAMGQSEVMSRIKWTPLKRIDRAIEKLSRSYGNHVPRLLDLCRECIIFETVHDLIRCLDAVARDLEVEILRIKNRLSNASDAWETAGYRFVQVNLRLVTPETRRLGVDGHVSELQLVLSSLWSAMTTVGHSNYVAWRNDRGA